MFIRGATRFLSRSLNVSQFAISRHVRYQMDARCISFLLLCSFVTYSKNSDIPKFGQAINNLTVPIGREAVLSCVVDDLSTYKVAWLRVDTQTILTIHSHVITKNHRIAVTQSDKRMWYLHIRDVTEADRGFYMCQINTDPMKSQVGYLEVVVPPDILDYPTSTDMVVREGNNVSLTCAASGSPSPRITWRKEGGELIALNGQEVSMVEGSTLNINRVKRLHMGAYLCIASNGIPPTVSKRIMLDVQYAPMIWVQNQLVGAQIGQSVTLDCISEAFPKGVNHWAKENGDQIAEGIKYNIEFTTNAHKTLMKLTIKAVTSSDIATYRCVSRNIIGVTDGTIKLYEIPAPTTLPTTTTTTATTTTMKQPEHRGVEPKKKVLKPKQEMNVNNINNIRINEKSLKSEYTERGSKTSKVAIVESGHVQTVLHSSSNSCRRCTSNRITTFTAFTTCIILSKHLLSYFKCSIC